MLPKGYMYICFTCKEYKLQVYKRAGYLVQYPLKVITKTTVGKIKIADTKAKTMRRKCFWLLLTSTWQQKSFKKTSTAIRTIQGLQVNQILPCRIQQYKNLPQT